MKNISTLLLFTLLSMSVLHAEISLSYGTGEGLVGYYNNNNHPKAQEPYPIGPLSFRLDGSYIWVADSIGAKIIKLSRSSEHIAEFSLINEEVESTIIEDFALEKDTENNTTSLWFIDGIKNRILHYSTDGELLHIVEHEKLIQPFGIEVGISGNLFVSDKAASSILVFNTSLELISSLNWEWSGFSIGKRSETLYRLFFMDESQSTYLVASDFTGKILFEVELDLPQHFNPVLWKVDEELRELLLTYTLPSGFEGTFVITRLGFDGITIASDDFAPPYFMNRFLDLETFDDGWKGVANYEKAPDGLFKLQPFKLPGEQL